MSRTMYLIIVISFVKILESIFIMRYSQQSLGLFYPVFIAMTCIGMLAYHRGVISHGAERYIVAARKARQKNLRIRNKMNKRLWRCGWAISLIIGALIAWDIYRIYVVGIFFPINNHEALSVIVEKTYVSTSWLIYNFLVALQLICALGSRKESRF